MSPSVANRRIPVKSQNVDEQRFSVVLPGYRFIRQLGHGAQGEVYLAERDSDGLKVAIKKLNIGSVKTWKEYELFHREAEVLSSLDIKGVSKFYDAVDRLDDIPPCSYLVQEYIEARSMAEMLKNGHRFRIPQIYDILMQLLNILSKLHTHTPPVIHRDIKPSNILLKLLPQGGYQVYLIDFGAVANPQVQSGGSTVAGTYGYMPPEQLMGKPEPASDIYALGAVGVYLFTGKSPADMEQKDFHLIFEPEMQAFPVELVNTLRSMLEPDPKKRLWRYDDLYHLFKNFQQGNYTLTGSRRTSITVDEFDKKLCMVSAYGAEGNFELWQELDDHLPRSAKSLPQSYLALENADRNPDEYHFNKFANFQKSSLSKSKHYISFLKKIGMLAISWQQANTLIVITFVALLIIMEVTFGLHNVEIFIGLMTVFLVVANPVLTFWFYKRKEGRVIAQTSFIEFESGMYELSQDCLEKLLQNGRKTIATIVSIDYLKVSDDFVEFNLDAGRGGVRYAIHRSPSFKIRYSFNPPDDARSQDLVHEIHTHLDPEHHYNVGDPFPILYRIYRDGGAEYVDSMPFPVPLEDVFNDKNILFHDKFELS